MPLVLEQTLVIIKPESVQRGLVGEIIRRFERRGLKILGLRMDMISVQDAEIQYAAHRGKPFYSELIDWITSGPVVLMVLEGPDAIAVVRRTIGSTRPNEAAPGTIRGDFAIAPDMRNLVHASEGKAAAQEIALYFVDHQELLSYSRSLDHWIFFQF